MTGKPEAVVKAQEYYDSSPAIAFYKNVWGGEDIHVGLYRSNEEEIGTASRRTVANMAQRLSPLAPGKRVIDLGAGFGGSARYLASNFGCHVTCVNVSEAQNLLNHEMNEEGSLLDLINIVHGNFEDVPQCAESFDVVWSQDAILHSADREAVLDEVQRLLKPNGEFIFTDPMQSKNCPPDALQPILDRIHLETLGSFDFYNDALRNAILRKSRRLIGLMICARTICASVKSCATITKKFATYREPNMSRICCVDSITGSTVRTMDI